MSNSADTCPVVNFGSDGANQVDGVHLTRVINYCLQRPSYGVERCLLWHFDKCLLYSRCLKPTR